MTNVDFKKPRRVTVDALSYLSDILKNGLIKDLTEDQVLCSTCQGTGLAIVDDVYGLKNDLDKRKHFPYSRQYIASCDNCYAGVINLCKYCKCELPRFSSRCDCEEYKATQRQTAIKKENELISKATKLKHNDPTAKEMGMYYHESYPYNNGYFNDVDDFMEWWESEFDEEVEKPKYVWGTYSVSLSLDALGILESACDDLHEEALNNISVSSINQLQGHLDNWCKKQTGTTTYYSDETYAIEIPWS